MIETRPRKRCGNRAGWVWRVPRDLVEAPALAPPAIARPVPKRSVAAPLTMRVLEKECVV